MKLPSFLLSIQVILLLSCSSKEEKIDPPIIVRKDSIPKKVEDTLEKWLIKGENLPGGEASIEDFTRDAFGNAAPNLKGDNELFFATGNAFFNRNWVTAPASTEDLDGLGPVFNARSCSACHFKDGRGKPQPSPSDHPVALLFRLSVPSKIKWEVIPDKNYGGQFQHRSIMGIEPEGKVSINYSTISGKYPDGTTYTLRKPNYQFSDLKYGAFPSNIMISPRIAPQMIGMGLLEAIDESDLKKNADPNDSNKDEISGKLNYVDGVQSKTKGIGRFGWKADQTTVRQQVAAAFQNDIGITSSLLPAQPCAEGQIDCQKAIHGGKPELTDKILDRVTLYSSSLAVPTRREWKNKEVLTGKKLFFEIGCEKCHISSYTTGKAKEFEAFSNQKIFPYTDLLLHDMGKGLADGSIVGKAQGNEWKTPPLWGIGLIKTVNKHTTLLHDGRARNVEEAILWHGGEAENIKNKFKKLTKTQRNLIIKFVNSL